MKAIFLIIIVVLAGSVNLDDVKAEFDNMDPEGVIAVTPVLERSCIALRISVAKTQALSGFRWWHNDSATAFPKVLVASGLNDVPPLYADGHIVGAGVAGAEEGWSELQFPEPIASDTGTLYLIFRLPVGGEGIVRGEGAGFGYAATDVESSIWMSPDGDEWLRIGTNYQLLVEPVYTDRGEATRALKCSMAGIDSITDAEEESSEVKIVRTELLEPYPNPFNPATTVTFTLLAPSEVNISIYDLRGRLVYKLLDDYRNAGVHSLQWEGRDSSGRGVGCGMYFVRMSASEIEQIQRMTLLK